MNARASLHDLETQLSDAHRAERDEHRDAARFDRTEYTRVGGTWRDANDVPSLRDVADLGDE